MDAYIYIADFIAGRYQQTYTKYNLSEDQNIIFNELSMVHFEIVSKTLINIDEFKFVLGITSFNLSSTYFNSVDSYHYILEIDRTIFNDTKATYNLKHQSTKFYQLFLNDLGFVKPQIIYEDSIYYFNQIQINSNKISDKNFDFIIKYLMLNNYFDEDILYKTSIPTDFADLKNSLLESLKLLHKKINKSSKNISVFQHNSLKKYKTNYNVLPYNPNSLIDDQSFDWLLSNLDVIQKNQGNRAFDLKINSIKCDITELNQQISSNSYNSYENRLILGYSKLYILKLIELRKNSGIKTNPRTRYIGDFQAYLLLKYNEILDLYINEIVSYFNYTHNYFENVLKIKEPIYEFPKDLFSFSSLVHYYEWFELILLYNNLFSKEINNNNSLQSNLEIESFDKLFEIYIFYLLKDIISLNSNNNYEFIPNGNVRNKLSGNYYFKQNSDQINVTLYYESLPEEIQLITLFTTEDKKYNPDYVIEFEKNGYKDFLILDAKYKNYNSLERFKYDVKELTFKYLHGLGVVGSKSKISGLYIIYTNDKDHFKKVFRTKFDILTSSTPSTPSIAGVSINPTNFQIQDNFLLKIINKHLEIFKLKILQQNL